MPLAFLGPLGLSLCPGPAESLLPFRRYRTPGQDSSYEQSNHRLSRHDSHGLVVAPLLNHLVGPPQERSAGCMISPPHDRGIAIEADALICLIRAELASQAYSRIGKVRRPTHFLDLCAMQVEVESNKRDPLVSVPGSRNWMRGNHLVRSEPAKPAR